MNITCIEDGPMLQFDGERNGLRREGIAYASQWWSENPLVCIPLPLEKKAVTNILLEIKKKRLENGIK
jgi:hypothetical protein